MALVAFRLQAAAELAVLRHLTPKVRLGAGPQRARLATRSVKLRAVKAARLPVEVILEVAPADHRAVAAPADGALDFRETFPLRFLGVERDLLERVGGDVMPRRRDVAHLVNQPQQLDAAADHRLGHGEMGGDRLLRDAELQHAADQLRVPQRIDAAAHFVLCPRDFMGAALGDADIDKRRNRTQTARPRRLQPPVAGNDKQGLTLAPVPHGKRLVDPTRLDGFDQLDHCRIIPRQLLRASRIPGRMLKIGDLESFQLNLFHFF